MSLELLPRFQPEDPQPRVRLPDHQTLVRVALVLFISSLAALFFITCRIRDLTPGGFTGLLKAALFGCADRDAVKESPKPEKTNPPPAAKTPGPGPGLARMGPADPALGPGNSVVIYQLPEPAAGLRALAWHQAGAGDLPGAVKNMDQALQAAPDQVLLKREMSHLLAAIGWQAYQARDYVKAGGFFEESLFYWPENPESLRGLAFTSFQQRDREKSEQWLKKFFKQGGDRPEAYALMGRICYESDRLSEALTNFQISLTLNPEQPEVTQLVAKIKREAKVEADFDRTETRHFVIKYEGLALPEVARMVEGVLEESYLKVGSRLGYYPEEPVMVLLYTDRQFSDVTRSPAWAGAVFDGKIRIPAKGLSQRSGALEQIIAHEYTHALVHEVTQGRAPVWLQEGLAQQSENLPETPALVAKRLIASGGPFPLKNLEQSFVAMPEAEAQLAYMESWLVVQYLEQRSGPFTLREILRALGDGDDINSALRQAAGRDYAALDPDFRAWLTALAQSVEKE